MIEITDKNKKLINEIAQKYDLELLLLFGSQVTGKTHKESDYDIGFLSERELSLEERGYLMLDLMPVLGVRDERLIETVNLAKTNSLFMHAVTSNAQLFYQKRPILFAELQDLAFKKYVETKPLYEMKLERLKEKYV